MLNQIYPSSDSVFEPEVFLDQDTKLASQIFQVYQNHMLLWSIKAVLEGYARFPSSNLLGYVSGLPSCYANCFGLPLLNLWNYFERYKNKKPLM